MDNKIDTSNPAYLPATGAAGGARAGATEAPRTDSPRTDVGADTVELTESGRQMAALEAAVAAAPEVDSARVEAMRAKVQSGDYQIDAQRLADNLLRLDTGLPEGR